jgi:hypothetical protein
VVYVEFHRGIQLGETAQQLRRQNETSCPCQSEPQSTGAASRDVLECNHPPIGGIERCPSVRQEGATRVRELDISGRAVEELDSQSSFQLRNGCAQGLLRDIDAARRCREAELFSEGDEVAQLPELGRRRCARDHEAIPTSELAWIQANYSKLEIK